MYIFTSKREIDLMYIFTSKREIDYLLVLHRLDWYLIFCRVKAIIQESKSEVTAETVKQQLSMPSIYEYNNHRDGKFIHEGDLQSIMNVGHIAFPSTDFQQSECNFAY